MRGLASGLPVYSQPYHQIDLNGDYEFNKHFMLTASVINLTKSTPHSYLGSDTRARLDFLDTVLAKDEPYNVKDLEKLALHGSAIQSVKEAIAFPRLIGAEAFAAGL